jgi:predicted N-acyltransferase
MSVAELVTSATITQYDRLQDIDRAQFEALYKKVNAPIFYQWAFLQSAEKNHLLPVTATVYLVARRHGEMVGFTQAYVLPKADPFGVLAQTTGLPITDNKPGLFSHIMHFYESTIIGDVSDSVLMVQMLEALKGCAAERGVEYCGLINVIDPQLLDCGRSQGWHVNEMWDRYNIDFTPLNDMEDFLATLTRAGRNEIRRQRRKFEASEAICTVTQAPFTDLDAIAKLCFDTTSKNGTPQYYPPEVFKAFVADCEEWVRVFTIKQADQYLGTLVCFEEQGTLHLWAGGMVYDKSDFSPYTMLFYHTYQYALTHGLDCIEAGRTNKKIKERLGFKAKPLYSIISTHPIQTEN